MSAAKKKKVSLALQGGGALGAYAWGVLDRLFEEDERIEIAAISGCSAGAMNAVVAAEGFAKGGAKGAREKLRDFWEGIARAGAGSPYRRTPLMGLMSAFTPAWAQSFWSTWADLSSRVASPYDLNPLNINPLKGLLEELVDFSAVRAADAIPLFISATNVETGRVRVFCNGELDTDHMLASACLPLVFQAVVIDGVPYWDGGYSGNPPLFPLFDVQTTCDILIVQINPIERKGLMPRSAADIIARLNEITFNSSLLSELRAIDFVTRLLEQGHLPEGRYRKMLVHMIGEDKAVSPLGFGTDMNTDLSFFEDLFKSGRHACTEWLKANFDALGDHSTVDLRRLFVGENAPPPKPMPKAKN